MKIKVLFFLGLVCLICLYAFSATAQVSDIQKVLITDPAVLESMGFPPNATNVYRNVNAGTMSNNKIESNDFGTNSNFTALAPKSFIGRQNTAAAPWQYTGGGVGCCTNLSRDGAENFADAPLDLPDGASLDFIRHWMNDVDAVNDMALFVFEVCLPSFGPGPTTLTTIGSLDPATTGATGNQSAVITFIPSITINNRDCTYIVRVRFDATGPTQTLQKVRAEWTRQISPAPLAATFGDVPLGHAFFQFVEALAASGITTGCAVGQYCPDQPVTRAQMAAFIARALGL
ncbi:MAG: hypothetical protein A2V86_05710 [Deltaproteobacteria bacterium RBG_16_49_23]|nr:MAG: hypothetical protein A2V86_05705 [Deltaproteobacteria bacterium RBG_16_49_23]OGP75873.1 MAG: hypothetical protein A2V86_05710 [Deltaproteobacteria bacterium RBG_16_49_23]